MSLVQSIRYVCSQCKLPFRYNNQCRCALCKIKIDADICKNCHMNNHIRNAGTFMVAMAVLAGITQVWQGVLFG